MWIAVKREATRCIRSTKRVQDTVRVDGVEARVHARGSGSVRVGVEKSADVVPLAAPSPDAAAPVPSFSQLARAAVPDGRQLVRSARGTHVSIAANSGNPRGARRSLAARRGE
jgi:hypothetical protein